MVGRMNETGSDCSDWSGVIEMRLLGINAANVEIGSPEAKINHHETPFRLVETRDAGLRQRSA